MITTIATKRKKGPRGPGSNNDTLHYGLFIITTAARNSLWRLNFWIYNMTRNIYWISKRSEFKGLSVKTPKPELKNMLGSKNNHYSPICPAVNGSRNEVLFSQSYKYDQKQVLYSKYCIWSPRVLPSLTKHYLAWKSRLKRTKHYSSKRIVYKSSKSDDYLATIWYRAHTNKKCQFDIFWRMYCFC